MGFSTIGGSFGGGAPETPAGDGSSQVAFKTIAVSGQDNVVADAADDTLTIVAGSNVTVTTNAGADSVTIAASGGGSALNGIDDQSSSLDDCITILDAEVVINEDGDNQDFRVEGDTVTSLFHCDAENERVGIGTAAPSKIFEINDDSDSATGKFIFDGAVTSGYALTTSLDQTGAKIGHNSGGRDFRLQTANTARLTILGGGNVGVGTTGPDSLFEVSKAAADAEVLVSAYHDTEATAPIVRFRKADNTEASPAAVDDNAVLGVVDFLGHDGTNFERGAKIEARVDGTSGNNDLPTELTFWTTPDGSNTCAERFAIKPDGRGLADFAAFAWMYYDDRQSQFQSLASGASYNVSSIAAGDTNGSASEGDYKITFTNAAPNAVYCIMAGGNSDWAAYASPYEGSQTTTEFDIQGSEGGGYNDLEEIYILVHAIKG